jgi:tRNA U34 5-methylaminomethyl-2-thiouridine-forming methyltransferase MnmC
MERKLIVTGDGSHSIEVPDRDVTYHSIHGAVQESRHVFIEAGLHACAGLERPGGLRIFEMAFGTGLNALLTLIESEKQKQNIYYETIELYPLKPDEVKLLNYCSILGRDDLQETFERFHDCEWEKEISIPSNFVFKKTKTNLLTFQSSESFELIFFDAFAPNAQPELWTEEIFKKMFSALKEKGALITYSSKGTVRRAMQSAGFVVEKIPGPPGKREITRALKAK